MADAADPNSDGAVACVMGNGAFFCLGRRGLSPATACSTHFHRRRDGREATAVRQGDGAAILLAGVPIGWAGGVYAQDGPEAPKVRIGIIA